MREGSQIRKRRAGQGAGSFSFKGLRGRGGAPAMMRRGEFTDTDGNGARIWGAGHHSNYMGLWGNAFENAPRGWRPARTRSERPLRVRLTRLPFSRTILRRMNAARQLASGSLDLEHHTPPGT